MLVPERQHLQKKKNRKHENITNKQAPSVRLNIRGRMKALKEAHRCSAHLSMKESIKKACVFGGPWCPPLPPGHASEEAG